MHPFDPKTVLLAKHAQHVVLVHFPIALFLVGVAFDVVAQRTKRQDLATVARYNLVLAAISVVPVVATGLAAWHFALQACWSASLAIYICAPCENPNDHYPARALLLKSWEQLLSLSPGTSAAS